MAAVWQVQDAKNRLSELMDRAVKEGPQVITRHGKPIVKVVAVDADEAKEPEDDGFVERPAESIFPFFINMILSAERTVSGRCAMITRVTLSDIIARFTALSFATSR